MLSPSVRQACDEPAALSHHALGFDGPAVGLDEPAGYGEPKPGAPGAAGTGGVGAVEAVEDPLQVIGSDSRPGVGHLHLDGTVAGMGRHGYAAALRRVGYGVFQQVSYGLGDAGWVQVQLRQGLSQIDVQGHALGFGPGPQGVDAGLHKLFRAGARHVAA